ncbi:hypothetical protein [Streptomyces sp. NBC_00091]|uniref:hypothetical protein n=1 Tax=Streptomyces sp. NBC_00091 TaxID=2975648 RepID=UPI00224E02C7|nr:hypothetical protein [Streptomyces sp. NBC_00091]MCX5378359.1 hypothetical protein [Streptomyces sp. NBC_00091]
MSYNQPGPYGQQPQQPGPYGQQPPQAPNPYGQQPQQPGYGYPQQAPPPPGPPQGYPQQGGYQQPPQPPQPAYGYQQPQTPPYGGMPAQQPPKKSKAGPIIAVVLVVAVIAAGGWWFLGGGSGGSVSDATKGYKLVAPESVGEFLKNPKYQEQPMSDKDKQEAEAAGIKNPAQVGMSYSSGDPKNALTAKGLNFSGVYGELADPEKTVDSYFAMAKLNAAKKNEKMTVELIGSPKEITPAGFKGAVLKCQDIKFTSNDPAYKGPKEYTLPVCIWGDYSTVAVVTASDAVSILAGKPGYTLEQNADFAAKLYNTARVKK